MSITDIAVSKNSAEEIQLFNQGFYKIDVNLNKDGNSTYIWFKRQNYMAPITRIQVSSNDDMSDGLSKAGYIKIERALTGNYIFLWYLRGIGSFDIPIQNLEVSTSADNEAEMIKLGLERAGCNLSGVPDDWVYLWMKREKKTYICDVTATNSNGSDVDLFQKGYIRIDETTNTIPPPVFYNSPNFLWYRQTTDPKGTITDLKISTSLSEYQNQGYTRVNVNLNDGGKTPVYLWYLKVESDRPPYCPVRSMLLLLNKSAIEAYEKAGINVVQTNISFDNDEAPRFLCFLNKQ